MSGAPTEATRVEPRRASARSGLTLVEIVFAAAILSLFLTGLFAAMSASMTSEAMVREHQAASEAAGQQLDSFLTDPNLQFQDAETYFDVQVKTGKANPGAAEDLLRVADPLPAGWAQARPGRVQVDQNPTVNGVALGNNVVRITASVVWRSRNDSTGRIDLVTLRVR